MMKGRTKYGYHDVFYSGDGFLCSLYMESPNMTSETVLIALGVMTWENFWASLPNT